MTGPSDGKPRLTINATPARAARIVRPIAEQPAAQQHQSAGETVHFDNYESAEAQVEAAQFAFINTSPVQDPATAYAAPDKSRQTPPLPSTAAFAAGSAGAGFVGRNALPLTIGLAFVLTFSLGIMTAIAMMGQPSQSTAEALPDLNSVVAASMQEDVTRSESSDLLGVAQTEEDAGFDPQAAALASAVLLGLTPKRTVGKLTDEEAKQALAEAEAILSHNKLRMLREGVLGGVYRVEATQVAGKNRVKLQMLNAAITKDVIANLLTDAAAKGVIEIPASLSTAEGDLDMDTMLFNLIQTSLANDGTVDGAEAAREMSRRAFAASGAKARDVGGARVYVVERGDSLAYISLQFYGRPGEYERIFAANRDVLTSPDMIQVGQRLKIPS